MVIVHVRSVKNDNYNVKGTKIATGYGVLHCFILHSCHEAEPCHGMAHVTPRPTLPWEITETNISAHIFEVIEKIIQLFCYCLDQLSVRIVNTDNSTHKQNVIAI